MVATVNRDGALKGRSAVVTGASRGIGEAIAYSLAMEGANVIVSARTVNEGDHPLPGTITKTVETIRSAGGEAYAVQCNLALPEDRANLAEESRKKYGPIDILVNNAAITYFIPTKDFPDKRARLMFEVQVIAAMDLSQRFLPDMVDQGRGHIIYISSGAAIHPTNPSAGGGGGTVYGMCKAAMERFSTGFAAEVYADNIAVNAISPGLVATPGTQLHGLVNESTKSRESPVEAIAEATCFIARSNPKEITGRIDHIQPFMDEFSLENVELIAQIQSYDPSDR